MKCFLIFLKFEIETSWKMLNPIYYCLRLDRKPNYRLMMNTKSYLKNSQLQRRDPLNFQTLPIHYYAITIKTYLIILEIENKRYIHTIFRLLSYNWKYVYSVSDNLVLHKTIKFRRKYLVNVRIRSSGIAL